MSIRIAVRGLCAAGAALGLVGALAQESARIPAERTAASAVDPEWQVPRLSWGAPNLEGTFTSRDMSGIPMSRPERYGNRQTLTEAEFLERVNADAGGLAAIVEANREDSENRLQLSALDSAESGTRTFAYTSYIIEPENGQFPQLTEEGRERQAAASGGQANGPFFTVEDFSYYDRCITRGVTGSILPSLYGDAMRIVQTPNAIAITYEMLHDTRIIPLDGRPQGDPAVRQYMGTSVGHWEGDTLVVETTNFTDELPVGRMAHSEELKLTERFTRIDPEMIDYVVRIEDPRTFTEPWSFRLTLTVQHDYEVLEYSCHEGNFFVASALRAEQNYQLSVAEARRRGEPIPERNLPSGGATLEIYEAPSASDAVDINAAR